MKAFTAYLAYSDKSKDSLNLYKECLSGDLTSMLTFMEFDHHVPEKMDERIYNPDFNNGKFIFKAHLFQMVENFGMLKDKYGIQWMFVNIE